METILSIIQSILKFIINIIFGLASLILSAFSFLDIFGITDALKDQDTNMIHEANDDLEVEKTSLE